MGGGEGVLAAGGRDTDSGPPRQVQDGPVGSPGFHPPEDRQGRDGRDQQVLVEGGQRHVLVLAAAHTEGDAGGGGVQGIHLHVGHLKATDTQLIRDAYEFWGLAAIRWQMPPRVDHFPATGPVLLPVWWPLVTRFQVKLALAT